MFFVDIIDGVAFRMYASDKSWSDDSHEITEEQFNSCTLPCHAEVTEDGVVFGDVVPLEEVPDTGVVVEPEVPDPETPDVPETNEVSWDAMAEAIKEGVNEV